MLPEIQSTAATLIDTINAAAAALDATAALELQAALANLQRAADAAKERMADAANRTRTTLSDLTADAAGIVALLAADINRPVNSSSQEKTAQKSCADVQLSESDSEPADALPAAAATPALSSASTLPTNDADEVLTTAANPPVESPPDADASPKRDTRKSDTRKPGPRRPKR